MKSFILLLASLLLFFGSSFAQSCVSLSNGAWNAPATWSCGAVPSGGDNVTIQLGDTVTISSVTTLSGLPVTLTINGVLLFNSPSAKLRLPCGSVIIISATGSIQSTGVGQASHNIRICGDEVWVGSEGTLTGPLVIGILLPIELAYFDVETDGANIQFSWQTISEKNNNFFTIEGSTNAVTWNEIHRIDGAGTTQKVQNYAYESRNDQMYSYFRLKQTDFDGQFAYSDVVAVELDQDELKIYPNPSNGAVLNIEIPSRKFGTLHILESDGRIVYSKELTGHQKLQLTDINLKAGTYLVQIEQEGQISMQRLVIQ